MRLAVLKIAQNESISNHPQQPEVDPAQQVFNLFLTILHSYFSHCFLNPSL